MTHKVKFENRETSIYKFPDRLQNLIYLLSQTNNLTSNQVCQSLKTAKIQPEDLLPWTTFDHPITHSYGRKLVYHGGYFEVMVMSWAPGDISAIHDHGKTQWGAVQCFGKAKHWSFQLDNRLLQTREYSEITPGQIVEVSHELIHQMGNYTQDYFLSLHIYGNSQKPSSITGNARIFDLFEQTIQYTDGGVFFCLPETDISRKILGISADPASALRHHKQMYSRINSILRFFPPDLEYWQAKALKLEREISRLSQIENLN